MCVCVCEGRRKLDDEDEDDAGWGRTTVTFCLVSNLAPEAFRRLLKRCL